MKRRKIVKVWSSKGQEVLSVNCCSSVSELRMNLPDELKQVPSRFIYSGNIIPLEEESNSFTAEETELNFVIITGTTAISAKRTDTSGCIIRKIEPNAGRCSGGEIVTLFGTFPPVHALTLKIKFGNIIVPFRAQVSRNVITVSTPEHEPGVVSVEVASNGVNFSSSNDVFYTFLPISNAIIHPLRVPVDVSPSYAPVIPLPQVSQHPINRFF